MNVKERLIKFLEYKHLTQLEFTRRIGVASSYVAAMRRSISDDKIIRIRKEFPELNTSWLLYGEGKMLKSQYYSPVDGDGAGIRENVSGQRYYEVPLLPVAAYAGNLQYWSEGVMMKDCEKVITTVKGSEFAIKVTGNSMEPELYDGATLLIKKINEYAFIPWGNKLVIDTENGVLVKKVFPVEDEPGMIEVRSVNPEYPPYRISTESIYGMYRILGQVQVYTTLS